MKRLIPLLVSLFAIPLHSNPNAERIQLAGQVELSKVSYEISLDARFVEEKAHTIQYRGEALLQNKGEKIKRPMTLYVTKRKDRPRSIISILMSGDAQNEGLYLELVGEKVPSTLNVGDLFSADAELMWMIRSPYRAFSDTTFLTRDRGQAQLELVALP